MGTKSKRLSKTVMIVSTGTKFNKKDKTTRSSFKIIHNSRVVGHVAQEIRADMPNFPFIMATVRTSKGPKQLKYKEGDGRKRAFFPSWQVAAKTVLRKHIANA